MLLQPWEREPLCGCALVVLGFVLDGLNKLS